MAFGLTAMVWQSAHYIEIRSTESSPISEILQIFFRKKLVRVGLLVHIRKNTLQSFYKEDSCTQRRKLSIIKNTITQNKMQGKVAMIGLLHSGGLNAKNDCSIIK